MTKKSYIWKELVFVEKDFIVRLEFEYLYLGRKLIHMYLVKADIWGSAYSLRECLLQLHMSICRENAYCVSVKTMYRSAKKTCALIECLTLIESLF